MKIILASGSPRRAELLKKMGVSFDVIKSKVKEGQPYKPIEKWVQELAKDKALSVLNETGDVVIGADTVVVLDGAVLGKPGSAAQAVEMLKALSGKEHHVITGICVAKKNNDDTSKTFNVYQDAAITKVVFRNIYPQEIEYYVASGEPMDKAGAYGIQGIGGLLVERIEGCYYNVVGLPLVKTMNILRKCGISVLGCC